MPNLKTIQTKNATIVSVTVNAVGVDPIGFLRHSRSEKCGLWTKADSWIAHSSPQPCERCPSERNYDDRSA